MSFKENTYQQMSFTDSFSGLTAREQKALEKSWAKVFADEIFPAIDEKRFSVLYSDKASRPNTPVNVIVGALIIKELFDYSDDEMVENLMLDFRIQYALHTTSFEEQSLSDKTLSRFPKRCYDYETLHNKDLYHDCVKDLSASIAKLVGISGKVRRMDSMMIESNVRRLSRMELIYTCIAKLVMYVNKINGSALSDDLKHYIDPNDFNRVIYHQRSTDADERMKQLLTDADKLLALCESDYNDSTEYDLFVRCLSEQTIVENENIVTDGKFAGYLVLSDTVRTESAGMIAQLKELNVQPVLLTGDHENAAAAIASQLQMTEVHTNCLPEDKMRWIADKQQKQESVCMMGDGVNDAPVLKKTNVGIAMGGIGSDIAIDAADIALVDDEVKELPHLLGLSKRMMVTIKCNLTFSMSLNFLAIILAMTGILNPVVGALVHNAGSVLVILNSAWLLKWKRRNEK